MNQNQPSADYRRGYQSGYAAGQNKGHLPPAWVKPLESFDLSDPVQMEGYQATRHGNPNPYDKTDERFFRFNCGCWVACGMATDRAELKPIEKWTSPPNKSGSGNSVLRVKIGRDQK